MNNIWQTIQNASSDSTEFTVQGMLLSLLLAFVLGQLIAWVYYFTHSGLSYSCSFVQSLVLMTVIVSMVMSTIAGSFIVAVGLMGALSIIRFRNIIKDTRDISFIFVALVVGMATGSQRYTIAILGTLMISLIILYLYWVDFGSHVPQNAFLRFNMTNQIHANHPVVMVMQKYCKKYTLISSQDPDFGASNIEYAYTLLLKNADDNEEMIAELGKVEGVENINLTVQEQLLHV